MATDLHEVVDRTFRSSPLFSLVRHEELPSDIRAGFSDLGASADHYGFLLPDAGSMLGVQAVDDRAAALFEGLRAPGPLPAVLRHAPDANRRVVLLVMDGVLEIEGGGGFVGGPAAHTEVLAAPFEPPRSRTKLARLTHEALRWAQAVPIPDPGELRSWLYRFGSLPFGPARARHLSSWAEIERAAGIDVVTDSGETLRQHYQGSETGGWMSWRHHDTRLEHLAPEGDRPAFKLYVSPLPHALGEVIPVVVDLAARHRVAAFKMGRDARGIVRADKFVMYFDDLSELFQFADEVRPHVAGCPAQGVPFTVELEAGGLLSWGMDPPRTLRIPGWLGSESWRVWIIERLARALVRARWLAPDGAEPRLAALDRVRAEGIDVDDWRPPTWLWQSEVRR